MNAKTELDEFLVAEFSRALLDFPPEAIETAFRNWRDVSPYFPAISNIRELCILWVRHFGEDREMEERAQRQREAEAARERGELLEWSDVLEKFAEIVERATAEKLATKKMPEVPRNAEIVIDPDRREMLRQQAIAVKAKYGAEK